VGVVVCLSLYFGFYLIALVVPVCLHFGPKNGPEVAPGKFWEQSAFKIEKLKARTKTK
jgi:hypothetical protein